MGLSAFEIIGPVMVGPSSSHTAGACRIGWAARHIFGALPESARLRLHGSFFATGEGHGTREALVAGLLGLAADDETLPTSFELAANQNLKIQFEEIDLGEQAHPNSVVIELQKENQTQSILGASVGGGSILIQKIGPSEVSLRGGLETLLLWHRDTPGFLARITAVLACLEINVASIHTSRKERGEDALTVIEIDGHFPAALLELVSCIPAVHRHSLLPILPGF
ncbi:MAG: L-serine ammonia-lyase, iron-sulfur-dependent subunit beta [Chthoniobacterales bacterium]